MAVLYRRATGAVSRGAALTALPPTAANLLGSQSEELGSGYLSWAPVASAGFRLDGPVQGSVRGRVEIDGSGQDAEEDDGPEGVLAQLRGVASNPPDCDRRDADADDRTG